MSGNLNQVLTRLKTPNDESIYFLSKDIETIIEGLKATLFSNNAEEQMKNILEGLPLDVINNLMGALNLSLGSALVSNYLIDYVGTEVKNIKSYQKYIVDNTKYTLYVEKINCIVNEFMTGFLDRDVLDTKLVDRLMSRFDDDDIIDENIPAEFMR